MGRPEAASLPDYSLPIAAMLAACSPGAGAAGVPHVRAPTEVDAGMAGRVPPAVRRARRRRRTVMGTLFATAIAGGLAWHMAGEPGVCRSVLQEADRSAAMHVASRIIVVESGGDANAKNPKSSATGAGQFVDGTWLDMIREYRPDLAGLDDAAVLALRTDPMLSREMVSRYAERNADMLRSKCLPVTPGTLYLSHFAGGAGAIAVLSADGDADAASVMADADARAFITRARIVEANPFLRSFTVADLRHWADRKMGIR